MQGAAEITADGKYRYDLTRWWSASYSKTRWCLWVMLNPSTADAAVNDPTITRCISFAAHAGFTGIAVVNLYAFSTTYPFELTVAKDPVGPLNDAHIRRWVKQSQRVVAAWGAFDGFPNNGVSRRSDAVLKLLPSATLCLGRTKAGAPKHPLYVPAATQMIQY